MLINTVSVTLQTKGREDCSNLHGLCDQVFMTLVLVVDKPAILNCEVNLLASILP